MTWGWDARGPLPANATGTGTTGGGAVGSASEARATKAWPRYEAEYLKRALTSERYKYDTEGLDDAQKQVYLDRVVGNYKSEADECLKAEFEQWLQGDHECNDSSKEQIYENAEGKPVRKWLARTPESADGNGGYKVGQARSGWKHTPWGRGTLTYLPGVKEYLRDQLYDSHNKDMQMQMLAEFGPQNIDEAWMYFKHWVKGRPLSDTVAVPGHFQEKADSSRALFNNLPERMYAYDSEPSDRQPGVYATDTHAENAAVTMPGAKPVLETTEHEDRTVQEARELRERMERYGDFTQREIRARDDAAEVKEQIQNDRREAQAHSEKAQQEWRHMEETTPKLALTPAL